MTLYSLDHLTQRFGDRLVLDIEHLEVETGRIHALIGPNGAGKTTLLHILAFLEQPAGGTLIFNGEVVDDSPQKLLQLRRRVVLVDQHPIMFSTSVCRNIEFGLKIRNIDRQARQKIVDEVLDRVDLRRYKEAAAHELSGGETQRLALARALALTPEVLLCDEPTASVDVENQAIIATLLQQINAERGTTIIFTTHDRLQAASLAQHTLVLEGGRLASTSYENDYACTFRLDNKTGNQLRCTLHDLVDIPLPVPPDWQPRTSGRIHIDPEKIRLSRDEHQLHTSPALTGQVVLAMAEGNRIRVVVNIGVLLVVLMSPNDYQHQAPTIGSRVRLHVPPDALTLL
jgi:tungstate transport system ATP-binding protein